MHSMWRGGEEHSPNSKGVLGEWRETSSQLRRILGRSSVRPGHIYIFLYEASRRGGLVSRYILMRETGLTEARAKTFMRKMIELGLARSMKGGHHLTERGEKLSKYLLNLVSDYSVKYKAIKNELDGWATYVKPVFKRELLIWLRDQVIRLGGEAALILRIKEGDIFFPESNERLERYHPDLYNELVGKPVFNKSSFIILSYAKTTEVARLSSLDTALTYLEILGY